MATDRMQEAAAKRARHENEVPGAGGAGLTRQRSGAAAPAQTSPQAIAGGVDAPAQPWATDHQILFARELRQRFRVAGGKQQLPVAMVGFDLCNRDGIPINGHRCDQLLKEIADMGFDPEEANFDNVCIQERPGRSDLLEFNRKVCGSQPYLADVTGDSMQFGTASHSHLHQCLRNIVYGSESSAPACFMIGGRLSLDAVERAQPLLAAACRNGLVWEVLSWKIRDEPGAIEVIQAACNRKGGVAMRETEMQAVARLSSICTSLNERASGVTFNDAREALRKSMPHIAEAPEFMGLLRFVVNVGANNAPFIADLKEFVGLRGQNRHVRANVFACVSQLPLTLPHLMVALIVTAYSAPPAFFFDGYSKFIVANDIKSLMSGHAPADPKQAPSIGCRASGPAATAAALEAEAILRYFHRLNLYQDVPNAKRLDFLSNLDSGVGRLLLGKHMGMLEESCPDMPRLAEKFFGDCLVLCGVDASKMPQKVWTVPTTPDASGSAGKSSRASGASVVIQPKVILFDEQGRPLTAQDVLKEEVTVEAVDFAATLTAPSLDIELAKGQVLSALHLVQAALPRMHDLVHVTRDSSGMVAVTAAVDLAEGQLVLLPLVASPSFVVPRKENGVYHAHAVRVGDLMIMPSVRMPPKGEKVADAKKSCFIPPLWLVARSPIREEANCDWSRIGVKPCTGVRLGERPLDLGTHTKMVHSPEVVIPVVTNTRAIGKGTTLVLFAPARVSTKKGAAETRWEDSARAVAKKKKQQD